MKHFRTIVQLVLALGLGIFIIWLSLRGLSAHDKAEILASFKRADYTWVVLSIILGGLSHLVRAARWRLMLEPMGYQTTLFGSFKAVMVGYFANMGIPRSGELARCTVLFRQNRIPVNKSFGTVIVERSIDLIIFTLLFLTAFLVEYQRINSYVQEIFSGVKGKGAGLAHGDNVVLYAVLGGVVLAVLLVIIFRKAIWNSGFGKKLLNLLNGLWEGLKSISQVKQVGLFIFYTLLIWVLYFLMVYLCFFALEETSDLGIMTGLSILVLGTIAIIVTPGGIGAYPFIVMKTAELYGIETTMGYSMGWITWSAQTLMIIVLGCISLVLLSFNNRNDVVPQET